MKYWIALALTLAMLLCSGAALAEGGAVEAPSRPVMPGRNYDFTIPLTRGGRKAGSEAFSVDRTPEMGARSTWTVTDPEAVSYKFWLCNFDYIEGNTVHLSTIYAQEDFQNSKTFSYTFREPLEYYLYCYAEHTDGSVETHLVTFTVEEKAGVETVASRVGEIVAQCRAAGVSGEYDTALWLHDWVVNNSYYDYGYHYHGADSILFYGTGVCDSYSKLYLMLLEEAGIEAIRITGGGHAWNAAKIEGVWCQIDTTWDDPGEDTVPVSGRECYEYFGLTDELMMLDHAYTPTVACTSLANYYPFRTQQYRTWLFHIWDQFGGNLQLGEISFDVSTGGKLVAEVENGVAVSWVIASTGNNREYVDNKYNISAKMLSELSWDYEGDRTVRCAFSYDAGAETLHCEVTVTGVDLVLPSGTREIGASAFENVKALVGVRIPAGTTLVGPGAFSGCTSLMWVVVEGSQTEFAPDAFNGVPAGFVVVCAHGSAAETYAADNNITVRYLDD